jgi:hypothetical protein
MSNAHINTHTHTHTHAGLLTYSDLVDALLVDGRWACQGVYVHGLLVPQVLTHSLLCEQERDLQIGICMGITRVRALCRRAGWQCAVRGDQITITALPLRSEKENPPAFEACESPIGTRVCVSMCVYVCLSMYLLCV